MFTISAALVVLSACAGYTGERYNECYNHTTERDTISLAFNTSGDQIKGMLDYRLFGKKRDFGTLKGFLRGDTLYGEFKFTSEDKREVTREVIFIKGRDFYREGYGTLVEVDGKLVFENKYQLNFGHTVKLTQQDCH